MKKFNNFDKINENTTEEVLLDNLFTFCYKKFKSISIDEVETKFSSLAKKLVEDSDVSQASLDKFLKTKGIDQTKKTSKKDPIKKAGGRIEQPSREESSSCGYQPAPRGGGRSYC